MTNYPIFYFRDEVIKQVVIGEKKNYFHNQEFHELDEIRLYVYTCVVDASRIVDAHVYTHLSVLMPPIIIIRSTNQPLRLVPIFFLILTRRFAKVQKPSRGERRVRERLFSLVSFLLAAGRKLHVHTREQSVLDGERDTTKSKLDCCSPYGSRSICHLMTIVNVG